MESKGATTKTGFDRLRGVATVSAIGLGLLGGGSARATATTTKLTITNVASSAFWSTIGYNGPTTTSFMQMVDQTSITTTGGFTLLPSDTGFAIGSASLSNATSSFADFYDGGMSLVVGDSVVGHTIFTDPTGIVDLTGDTLTSNVIADIIPDVDAQVEYYFDPARAVVRGLYSLTNTSGADIMTSALVMGNYGSDDDTTVQATESGDLVVTDADRWVVTDDNGVGPDPVATIASHGASAKVIPVTVMTLGTPPGGAGTGPDNYGYRYDVTIPAGETVRILVFNEMTASIAAATAGAADFESLTAADAAGLLTGLDAQTQKEIVNYRRVVIIDDNDNDNDNDDDGIWALGVPGLLGALGSLLLFRQRGRKTRH